VLLSFGVSPGSDKWGNLDLMADPTTWVLLGKRLTQEVSGYAGLVLVVVALVVAGRSAAPDRRGLLLPLAWAGGVAVYVLVVIGGHKAHDYYQLVAVQPFALLGAFLVSGVVGARDTEADPASPLARWWRPILLMALLALMTWELMPYRLFLTTWQDERWSEAGEALADVTTEDELILAIDHSLPEMFWAADRRGHHLRPDQAIPDAIEELRRRGVVAVSVLDPGGLQAQGHAGLAWLTENGQLTATGPGYAVFRLP
jgi:hypothetical protein